MQVALSIFFIEFLFLRWSELDIFEVSCYLYNSEKKIGAFFGCFFKSLKGRPALLSPEHNFTFYYHTQNKGCCTWSFNCSNENPSDAVWFCTKQTLIWSEKKMKSKQEFRKKNKGTRISFVSSRGKKKKNVGHVEYYKALRCKIWLHLLKNV